MSKFLVSLTQISSAIAFAIVVSACGGGSSSDTPNPPTPTPDTTAPTVTYTSPVYDSFGARLNMPLRAGFSEPLKSSTVTTGSVLLKQGLNIVNGAVVYDDVTNTVTFTPDVPLIRNTVYTATLTTDIEDLAGNALAADVEGEFTTTWTILDGTIEDEAVTLTVDDNGNIYAVGSTGGDFDGAHPGNVEEDIILIKHDSNGNELWHKQLGDATVPDAGFNVATDLSGVYITGETASDLDGAGTDVLSGVLDMFLIKYDHNGALQWGRQIGTSDYDGGESVISDGTYVYVAGASFGDMNGTDPGTNQGGVDAFVAKFEATNGNLLWVQQLGTAGFDAALDIAFSGADVVIAGFVNGDIDGLGTDTYAGADDIFLARYDTNGVLQWTSQFGTTESDVAEALDVDVDGNIYLAGWTQGDLDGNTRVVGDCRNSTGTIAPCRDLFVTKYDATGARQWTDTSGTKDDDLAFSLEFDTGFIYVAGVTGGNLDGQTFWTGFDMFAIKYDTTGSKQWTRLHGTQTSASIVDDAFGIAVDGGNIYLGGASDGDLDGLSNAGSNTSDLAIIKYDTNGNLY